MADKQEFTLPSGIGISAYKAYLSSLTNSSSVSTGALITPGGAGFGQSLSIGGTLQLFNGNNFTALKSSAVSNAIYTLPSNYPSTGSSVLQSDSAGLMSWVPMLVTGGITTSGLAITAIYAYESGYAVTSGFATTSNYAYQSGYATTSGLATTATYAYQSGYATTSGLATTANYAYQSGYAITSGFATTASNVNVVNANSNLAHPVIFGSTATGSGVALSSNTTLSYNPSTNILSTSGLAITATTASTSSSSGALTVAGGVGIAGSSYFGNDVTVGNSQTGRLNFSQGILGSAGTTTNPSLMFVGQDNNPITLSVLSDNTVSFEGSSGQLFSINNNLSSGTIFSVNDISGIPIIRANANGTLSMGEFTGSVGVGLTNPSYKLHIAGDTNLSSGYVFRINGNSVLSASSLGTGVTNSSLTSVGIISSGTWSGSTITGFYGGTGYTNYTKGDILVGAGNTFIKLNVGTDNFVLTASSSSATGLTWSPTAATGITTLNSLTSTQQFFAIGTSGSGFNISSSDSTHTFNIPIAGSGSTGLVTTLAQTIAGAKTFTSAIIGDLTGTATTANYALQSGYAITSGLATTSNYAHQSGYAITAGSSTNATTANYAHQSGYAITSGFASTSTLAYTVSSTSTNANADYNIPFFSGTALSTNSNLYYNPSTGRFNALLYAGSWAGNTITSFYGGTGYSTYSTGELLVGSGSTLSKLTVGTNNFILVADSSVAGGIKWANVSGFAITNINGLTASKQDLAFGYSGSVPAFSSSGSTHTLNIPLAGTGSTGLVSTQAQSFAGIKTFTNAVSVTDNTGSGSYTTGALIVSGGVGIGGTLNVQGDLNVQGTFTTINSTTITVADKNIELGVVATPTDITAQGGGITLRGATDKSINWYSGVGWSSSESWNLASGNTYKINGDSLLSSTSLGTGVTNSSLTALGVITTGTWSGSLITAFYGGTGYNSYTKGDILVGAGNTFIKLNVGTDNFVLTASSSSSTGLTWSPTAASGITTLNSLTVNQQFFATGSSGSGFNISSSGSTHTFNIPIAGTGATGLVSTLAQSFAGVKTFTNDVIISSSTASTFMRNGALQVYGGVGISGQLSFNQAAMGFTGILTNPSLAFIGTTGSPITLSVLADNSLSFEGSSGQLFSIDNNLTTGEIFAVSDISGLPIISAYANQNVTIGEFGGNLGIGLSNPFYKLHVVGSVGFTSNIASTSTSTGTLVVTGGVGIGGSLNVNSASSISAVKLDSGIIYGNLVGTATTAGFASTSTYSHQSGYAITSGIASTATYAIQAGYAVTSGSSSTANTATYAHQSGYGLTSGFATTANYANQSGYAITSGSSNTSGYATTAGLATTATYSIQSGYAITSGLATTATYAHQSGYAITSGFATTANYSNQSGYGLTSGFATTANYSNQSGYGLTSGFATTATYAHQSGYAVTSGSSAFATTATYAYQSGYGLTSGFATTANYSNQSGYAITSGTASTASYALQAGYAITSGASGLATTATYAHQSGYATTAGSSNTSGYATTAGLATTATYAHQSGYGLTSGFATTANYANQSGYAITSSSSGLATTATYAHQSGYAITSGSSGLATTATYAHQSGYATTSGNSNTSGYATTAGFATTANYSNQSGYGITAGFATTATYAHQSGYAITSGLATTSTYAHQSGYAITSGSSNTSGYATTAGLATTANYAHQSGYATTSGSSGLATTATYAHQSGYAITSGSSNTSGYATTSGFASTASYSNQSGYGLTSGLATTANYAHQSGYAITSGSSAFATTSGLATTANYAHQAGYAITSGSSTTSGLATTATYANQSGYATTSGLATTATYANQSGYANTSGIATSSYSSFVNTASANSSHPILFSPITGSSSGAGLSLNTILNYNPSSNILFTSGLAITATTVSSSTSTGALTVSGGVGISGRLSFNQASFGTTGISSNPTIAMIGSTGDPIYLSVLEDNTISFEGSQGQLFSITPNLSTGYIYSVNDITGIPLLRANANANVTANEYAGNFGIGLSNPGYKLHVIGSVGFTSNISSTSTTSGTLVVAGGVGIGGSLNVNSPSNISSVILNNGNIYGNLIGTATTAGFASTANYSNQSGYATTAGIANTATYANQSGYGLTSGFATTATYSHQSGYAITSGSSNTSGYATTSGLATTATYSYQSGYGLTSGLATTATYAHQSGYAITSGSSATATTATYALQSGYAITSGSSATATTSTYSHQSGYAITSGSSGTANTATYAHQSGYAITSGSSGFATTATYAHQSGYATTSGNSTTSGLATTATYAHQSGYAITSGSSGFATTANYSYQSGYGLTSGLATTAIYAHQSGYAITSGSSATATTATYAHQSGYAITSGSSGTANTATNAIQAGYAVTSGLATTANYANQSGYGLTSGFATTAAYAHQSGYAITSGSSNTSGYATTSGLATTATYAHQSGYATTAGSSGLASTATYAHQSGYGLTAGFATTANYSNQSGYAITSSSSGTANTATYAHQSGYATTSGSSNTSGYATTSGLATTATYSHQSGYAITSGSSGTATTATYAHQSGYAITSGSSATATTATYAHQSGYATTSGSSNTSGYATTSGLATTATYSHQSGYAITSGSSGTANTATYANQSGYAITSGLATTATYSYQSGYGLTAGLATSSYSSFINSATANTSHSLIFAPVTSSSSGSGLSLNSTLNFNPSTNILNTSGLAVTASTVSSSSTTGALTVAGGLGVGSTSYFNTDLNIGNSTRGRLYFSQATLGSAGTTVIPSMAFIGATNSPITLSVLPDNSLSFDGSSGQLFSINNNLSTGWIFSINDISGLPIFRANADLTVSMGEYGGNTGIGLSNPSYKLHVAGDTNLSSGYVYRINGTSVLSSSSLGIGVTNSSLTALGTITTGTWSGSTITSFYGGTGYQTYSTGDLLVGAGSTLSKLSVGTNNFVLVADNTVAGGVKWASVSGIAITNINGLTASKQDLAFGYSGNVPAFASSGNTHTLNIPLAGSGSTGLVSTQAQTFAGQKTFTSAIIGDLTGTATTAGFASTASYANQSGYGLTSGFATTSSYSHQSGYAITSGSSGTAITATYSHQSGYATTSGLATTANYSNQSGYAITSGLATTATNINVVLAATNASHQVLFTPTTGSASGVAVSTENSFVYNPSTDILSVSGLAVTSGLASTSTTTGALIVAGGVGIGGSVNIGGRVGIGTNLLNGALNIQPPSTTTSAIVVRGNTSQSADLITAFSSTGTTNFAVNANGRVTLRGMDGLWNNDPLYNVFDVSQGRLNWNLTIWMYAGMFFPTSQTTFGQAANQFRIDHGGSTSVTGVVVKANDWNTNNRAFGIVNPAGSERTYIGNIGNLSVDISNRHTFDLATWNATNQIQTDVSGTAGTYVGYIFRGRVEGVDRFTVGPYGNTTVALGGTTVSTGLIIKAATSQAGNLFEAQSSVGSTIAYISSSGSIYSTGVINNSNSSTTALSVKDGSNNTKFNVDTIGGIVSVSSSTASTNTTSGALVVTGGVGIGGSLYVASATAISGVTINAGVITGNLVGTATTSGFASTASYSHQSGYAITSGSSNTSGYATTAGLATTATYAYQSGYGLTSGFATTANYSNQSGYAITSGSSGLATTATYSHQSGYATTAGLATTATYSHQSGYATTSGLATTANYSHQSGYGITAGLATTATYAHQSGYAITSGFATTATYSYQSGYGLTSGLATTATYSHQSGYAITSGLATTATYAHQSGYAITSGLATTATYANQSGYAITSGLATTATYALQSGYAITSGLATSSTSVFINNASANSYHPLVFTPILGSSSGAALSTNSTVSYNPSTNYLYTSGLAVTASTASTSTSTGALIVNGGVGISGQLSYNNALIGTTGIASQPTMTFIGANGDPVKLRVLDDSTLAFSGSQGQLFSINPVLNTGYIFSVNDISGVPLLRANADATVSMGEFAGNIGIGLSNPAYKLHVSGSVGFTSSASSTSSTSGALVVSGGVGIGGTLFSSSSYANSLSGVVLNNGVVTSGSWAGSLITGLYGGTGYNSYTKGDLLVGAGTTLIKHAVGSQNQILIADLYSGSGLSWATFANPTYGSFYSTTSQPVVGVGATTLVNFNSTYESNRVSIIGGAGTSSRVQIQDAGPFSITFSAQINLANGSQPKVGDFWFRVNGVDIPQSNTQMTITGKDYQTVITVNFVYTFANNDYFEIAFSSLDSQYRIEALTGLTSPPRPDVPSIICSVLPVTHIVGASGAGISGILSINGSTSSQQYFVEGHSGTNFNIQTGGGTHTFNIPYASTGATGLVTTLAQSFAGVKTFTNDTVISSSTASTSFSSGALFVAGGVGIGGSLNIQGDLNVLGTFTTINSTTITVADKNIELGVVSSPTDLTAQGGGITLRGVTDKSINWYSGVGWSSSESWNLASGNTYKINGTNVLSATSLGTGVTNSSLTALGTITTGVWSGTLITALYGGTGLVPSFTVGDILYANTSTTWGRLTANSNLGYVLTSAGSGATPTYVAPSTLSVGLATTATYAHQSGYAITSGLATTATYAHQSGYGSTSGFATTAGYSHQSGYAITSGSSNTSGFATTASYAYQSGYAITSGLATTSTYSHQSGYGLTSGFATTANYAIQSGYAITSGSSTTSGFATTAANFNLSNASTGTFYPVLSNTASSASGVGASVNSFFSFNAANGAFGATSVNILAGQSYSVGGNSVLSSSSLGTGVTNSSLTALGTITTGTWSGSTITSFYGGSGYQTYTTGDLLVGAGTTLIKLAVGSNNFVLTADNTVAGGVKWTATAATGLTTLNGLNAGMQYFATGTSGSGFNISSSGSTHTFNIPIAGTGATGLVSTLAQSFAGVKTFTNDVIISSSTASTFVRNGALQVYGGVGISGQLSFNQAAMGFTGILTNPSIAFIGTTGSPITLSVLADNSLSFEGSSGQLFSIDNNLTTGEIFAVSDISGLPIISAYANQNVTIGEFGGNLGIGLSNPFYKLHVVGSVGFTSNTASTSTSTGALIVTGGVGIGGSLNVNSASSISGVRIDSGIVYGNLTGTATTSGFATTANYSNQSGYGLTSGFATTSAYSYTSGYGITAGLATTATYSHQSGYAITSGSSGFATTATYAYQSGYGLTSGLATTATYAHQSGYAITSGSSNTSGYATTSGLATTATYALTSGYGITAGLATTATYALQSGYAITSGSSGLATTATNINVVSATTNASHPVLFTPTSGTASGAAVSTESTFVYNPSTDILSVSGLAITSGTVSSSPTTGALVVAGGVGIGGSLNVGDRTIASFGTYDYKLAGFATSFNGYASVVIQNFHPNSAVDSRLVFKNDLNNYAEIRYASSNPNFSYPNALTIRNQYGDVRIETGTGKTIQIRPLYVDEQRVSISPFGATPSTSSTTGALVVTGGVGIGGSLYTSSSNASSISGVILNNGAITNTGTITSTGVMSLSNSSTTALSIKDGSNNTKFNVDTIGGIVSVSSSTASTSTTSGALVVTGGVGIGGSLYVASATAISGVTINAGVITGNLTGTATTATYSHQSGYAITSGSSNTSGYATTSGFATTASYAYQSGYGLTSGLATTATYSHQSGYAITSGSSNTSGYATTSGFATTATYSYTSGYGITSGLATTATYAHQSGFAQTATSASTATTSTNSTFSTLTADTTNATRRLVFTANGTGSTSLYNTSTVFTNPFNSSVGASVFTGSGSVNIRPGIDATNGVSIGNSSGTPYVYFDTINGRIGINQPTPLYDLHIVGELSATNKSFVIDHPTKPDMMLRHGSLEGPENGVYVRGKLLNENIIELPDYWLGLVDEETITVSLTPIGKFSKMYVEKIENYKVYVNVEIGIVNCHFVVYGERKDIPKLDVEY